MRVEELIKRKQLQYISANNIESASNVIEIMSEQKLKVLKKLRDKLIDTYTFDELNSKEKLYQIKDTAWTMLEEEDLTTGGFYLDTNEKAEIFEALLQSMFGYGVLEPLINDDSITEIMVNQINKIYIEKNGKMELATNKWGENIRFNSIDELKYVIEKIVSQINRKIDESNPIVDARLPNGFRVNIALNPVSLDSHVLTIRKFPESPFTFEDLIRFGTLSFEAAFLLKCLVEARYNIIVSGGTGSGKTTFLNALIRFIEGNSRIITIEDSAELKISNIKNLIRLETRPPNVEGKGEITIRDLLRSALRMRPDRIIIGEVRGGEALDMLQAMNTGHDGSLSTIHANSSIDMLSRLETMVLMSGIELPLLSIRQQIVSAVEIVIHLGKLKDGSRKVLQISEILGVDSNGYVTQNLFEIKTKETEKDRFGVLKRTNKKMVRTEKFYYADMEPII